MSRTIWLLALSVLLLAGVVDLARMDFSSKLETDVSSLLPVGESEEARIVRKIISEEQGRGVYLAIEGLPPEAEARKAVESFFLDALGKSPLVDTVEKIGSQANLSALKLVNENRMGFLFPRWLADKRALYAAEGGSEVSFVDWVAERAVREMDAFLESPEAMELARPELMDPLLLSIGTLERLVDKNDGGLLEREEERTGAVGLYWAVLAESPLESETQDSLKRELANMEHSLRELNPGLMLRYGGLVKLAGASRERIQKDVLKINVLSIAGVVFVLGFLIRRPWRLLRGIPTIIAGGIGALSVSFHVFEQVNVIVLVIGSILIGTSIDYAIHLVFEEEAPGGFPTRRLVSYACLSTVAGFAILLFSELPLIRQIGVFVGSGLLSAYLMAKVSVPAGSISRECGLRGSFGHLVPQPVWVGLAALFSLIGAYGLVGVDWKDDLRNLEAPDPALMEEDMSLREKFGSRSISSVFITTGGSFLDALQYEDDLMRMVSEREAASRPFGLSLFLPIRSQVESLMETREELPLLFDGLKLALENEGYDMDAFDAFFEDASAFGDPSFAGEAYFEGLVKELADSLAGPMKGFIGESDGGCWTLSSYALPLSEASEIAALSDTSTLFSQLTFLNQMLDDHREALSRFGMLAMLFVFAAIALLSGARKGFFVVLYPSLAGALAIGLCSLLFGSLNMFHLVGCFLGGAIALDYALFAVEAYSQGVATPRSVLLSAGTTAASFSALGFSSIPVVRGLGVMVALLAVLALLLLHASQPILRKALQKR